MHVSTGAWAGRARPFAIMNNRPPFSQCTPAYFFGFGNNIDWFGRCKCGCVSKFIHCLFSTRKIESKWHKLASKHGKCWQAAHLRQSTLFSLQKIWISRCIPRKFLPWSRFCFTKYYWWVSEQSEQQAQNMETWCSCVHCDVDFPYILAANTFVFKLSTFEFPKKITFSNVINPKFDDNKNLENFVWW